MESMYSCRQPVVLTLAHRSPRPPGKLHKLERERVLSQHLCFDATVHQSQDQSLATSAEGLGGDVWNKAWQVGHHMHL